MRKNAVVRVDRSVVPSSRVGWRGRVCSTREAAASRTAVGASSAPCRGSGLSRPEASSAARVRTKSSFGSACGGASPVPIQPPQFGDDGREGPPLDIPHRVVMDAPLAAHGVDGHDVRVVQVRRRLRLVLEALERLVAQDGREGQDLQRHLAAERDLGRLVDDAHPASADLAEDAEVAQLADRRARLGVREGGQGRAPAGDAAELGHGRDGGPERPHPIDPIRVLPGDDVPVDRLARLVTVGQLVDELDQVGIGPGRHGGAVGVLVHRRLPASPSSIRPRRRSRARKWRTLTAPSVIPRTSAISRLESISR